jgi:hypothetical protein
MLHWEFVSYVYPANDIELLQGNFCPSLDCACDELVLRCGPCSNLRDHGHNHPRDASASKPWLGRSGDSDPSSANDCASDVQRRRSMDGLRPVVWPSMVAESARVADGDGGMGGRVR